MATTLGEIQALTTLGVELMSEGSYNDAATVFSHAVFYLAGSLDGPFQQESSSDPKLQAMHHQGHETSMPSQSPPTSTTPVDNGMCVRDVCLFGKEPSIANCDFYFNPFLFECTQVGEAGSPRLLKQLSFAAIICLFNMGLCFQLDYCIYHPEQDKLLNAALHYYREAFCMVLRDNSNETDYSEVIKTLMGVCTNASFCHAELGEVDQIQRWNARLGTILRFVPSCVIAPDDSSDFKDPASMSLGRDAHESSPEYLRAWRRAEQEHWMNTCQFFSLNAYHFGFGFNAAKAA